MSSHSFYVGPGRPPLRIDGWADLVAAAQTGTLAETQWVELKADIPAGADKANLELACDLASLSVDGGVLVVGVRDPGDKAEHVVGVAGPLEGLKSRIAQVAGSTRVQPPLHVQLTTVANPDDPERAVLVVAVPPSAGAPHMVDERYWGRGAVGKRPLTDAEASRLWAERRGRRDDFAHRLRALSSTFDPLPEKRRQYGHLYVLAEPAVAWTGTPLTDAVAGKRLPDLMSEASSFEPWPPSLRTLTYPVAHPDGLAAASVDDSALAGQERGLLYALLTDGGSVQVVSGQATTPYGDDQGPLCIPVNSAMEIVHQALQLAAHLAGTYLCYSGMMNVGVHMEGLKGLPPIQKFGAVRIGGPSPAPFRAAEYTRTATVAIADLAERTSAVVEALLGDLARGLGLRGFLFPYTDPAEIHRKG